MNSTTVVQADGATPKEVAGRTNHLVDGSSGHSSSRKIESTPSESPFKSPMHCVIGVQPNVDLPKTSTRKNKRNMSDAASLSQDVFSVQLTRGCSSRFKAKDKAILDPINSQCLLRYGATVNLNSKYGSSKPRAGKQCSLAFAASTTSSTAEGDGLVSEKGDGNLAKRRRRGNPDTRTLERIPIGLRCPTAPLAQDAFSVQLTRGCSSRYKGKNIVELDASIDSNSNTNSTKARGRKKCSSTPLIPSAEGDGFVSTAGDGNLAKRRRRDLRCPTSPLLLKPPTYCELCGAKKFYNESRVFCCSGGEVKVADVVYPPQLIELLCSQDERDVHFRKYLRLYNNMFAFSSIGGSIDACTQKRICV
ncbi:unnamed protein product [Amaranthus hypochondriacus]